MSVTTIPLTAAWTVADLVGQLGGISMHRIRLHPSPGCAAEVDVIAAEARDNRLCELVDGVLVEKVMGYYESRLAALLIHFLESFLEEHDLGIVAGESGMVRLAPGLVRIPDVSFVSWERLPGRKTPREPVPDLVPDFAVEILSESNTAAEMDRKLGEYLAAGVRLVWFVYPDTQSVHVYTSPKHCAVLSGTQVLDGGSVLPGFQLSIREWFDRAE